VASVAKKPSLGITELVRFRGHRGGIIPMHRALARLDYGLAELSTSIALTLAILFAWIKCLPFVCMFWRRIFFLGLQYLPLTAELSTTQHHFVILPRFDLPYFHIEGVLPDSALWGVTCALTLFGFAITFLFPPRLIPFTYAFRGALFVQLSALGYFAVRPAQFPYTPSEYLQGLVMTGLAVITMVPLLFCLTYHIFHFSIFKKAFLTLLTMAYLCLFLPLQVLLQALILQKSVLFMPVLYLIWGMPLDVLIVVALYSWGMTWKFAESTPH
jgi:hypothetical protein